MERDLTGEVFRRIKESGLSIEQLRTVTPIWGLVEEHYDEQREKDVFDPLVDYIAESIIQAAVVSGEDAASQLRDIAGDTEPVSADEGTIRGDPGDNSYEAADQEGRALQNLVHASEPDNAEDELRLWFRDRCNSSCRGSTAPSIWSSLEGPE